MVVSRKIILTVFLLILSIELFPQVNGLTEYVNPFIGTANGGNTFPGAVVPWGMASVSPHNSVGAPSGYIYGEDEFFGLGHTHLSGTGCADLGGVILMALKPENNLKNYSSSYSGESASPGFYRVILDQANVTAEVTATERCGMTKFTASENTTINVILDAGSSLNLTGGGKLNILSETAVSGYNISGGFCGEENRQTVYFSAKFSSVGSNQTLFKNFHSTKSNSITAVDTSVIYSSIYNLSKGESLVIKIGISYVSSENARLNLDTEIPDWNFDEVKRNAELKWEKELSRIVVQGEKHEDKIKFYSALYHMLIHPNIISDVNGDYPLMGRNGTGSYENGIRYSIYSLWDTYRTLHPFMSLVYPDRQIAMVRTMVDMYKESGALPKWELTGAETYMMVGDPAAIVLADTYIRGLVDFDVHSAFEAMLKSTQLNKSEKAPPVRAGYHELLQYGYIPFEQDWDGDWWVWGPVSTTLEYCLADWSIAQLAKKIDQQDFHELYLERSLSYKNLFDTSTLFMRPKLKNGNWLEPFDSLATEGAGDWTGAGGPGYVEGNAWNYTWFVPHDIEGLVEQFGGAYKFTSKLLRSFENGQFTITNEPDIAYPYLFTYIKGKEEHTARLVDSIMANEFGTGPAGLPGNDDCGTISGWYAFSALGFYPACVGSEEYRIGIPLFERATIKLNNEYYPGKELVIESDKSNTSGNNLVVTFEGNSITNYTLRHSEIVKGGILKFTVNEVTN